MEEGETRGKLKRRILASTAYGEKEGSTTSLCWETSYIDAINQRIILQTEFRDSDATKSESLSFHQGVGRGPQE